MKDVLNKLLILFPRGRAMGNMVRYLKTVRSLNWPTTFEAFWLHSIHSNLALAKLAFHMMRDITFYVVRNVDG